MKFHFKNKLVKSTLAGLMLASFSNVSLAQGIPVFDGTAVMNMIAQAQQLAAQLVELKAQVEALTGFKGFAEDLQGINKEITDILENVKQGKQGLLSLSDEALGKVMQSEIAQRLKAVEDLSKKIQQAPDTKAMSEIQANIALEANAIELLKQQADLVKEERQARLTTVMHKNMSSLDDMITSVSDSPNSNSQKNEQNSDSELGGLLEL